MEKPHSDGNHANDLEYMTFIIITFNDIGTSSSLGHHSNCTSPASSVGNSTTITTVYGVGGVVIGILCGLLRYLIAPFMVSSSISFPSAVNMSSGEQQSIIQLQKQLIDTKAELAKLVADKKMTEAKHKKTLQTFQEKYLFALQECNRS
jgi:hypothetical protein